MMLADYLRTLTAKKRRALARKIVTTEQNLYQIAGGHTGVSAELGLAIERATNMTVTLPELLAAKKAREDTKRNAV